MGFEKLDKDVLGQGAADPDNTDAAGTGWCCNRSNSIFCAVVGINVLGRDHVHASSKQAGIT